MNDLWNPKPIPNEDTLYYRFFRDNYRHGKVTAKAFRDRDGQGMSTNWSRYANAEETRSQAPSPLQNGVVGMNVGNVRAISTGEHHQLRVVHTPDRLTNNPAHTDVHGLYGLSREDETEVRLRLLTISVLELAPEDLG